MSVTSVDVLDGTVQDTKVWLEAIMRHLESVDRHLACTDLRATLRALRVRIGPDNAVHLGAQLPTLIRGRHYEGWHMAGTPTRERHKAQFLEHVSWAFDRRMGINPDRIARAVFEVIWGKVDPGEVAKVINLLPVELCQLCPRVARQD